MLRVVTDTKGLKLNSFKEEKRMEERKKLNFAHLAHSSEYQLTFTSELNIWGANKKKQRWE